MAKTMHMGKQFTANPLRKFRWALEITGGKGGNVEHYIKTFSRPSIDFDETELNFRHEKMWIAGKATWGDISMTVLDVEEEGPMYKWIIDVYKLAGTAGAAGGGLPEDAFTMGRDAGTGKYKRNLKLFMLDGKGKTIEEWSLLNAWPRSSNFGDLDYSSSDTADIEVTLRFDRAVLVSKAGVT